MPSKHGEKVERFYHSTFWKKCRQRILHERHFVCELCGKRGTEVHHKIPLDENNVGNPEILINEDNLQLLCHECHTKITAGTYGDCRATFDKDGNVVNIRDEKTTKL